MNTTLKFSKIMYTKSFLKWAGGKYRLLDHILPHVQGFMRYIEPFCGSAAVYLNVSAPVAILNDINPDLMKLMAGIQKSRNFIPYAAEFFRPENNTAEAYYRLRNTFNTSRNRKERAALLLFLNRHAFNGLIRFNASGHFNVPFGKYRTPKFPMDEILAFRKRTGQGQTSFMARDFRDMFADVGQGDVVYCDPPYSPLPGTICFDHYAGNSFTQRDHEDLARLARQAQQNGATVVLSNHDTEFTRALYDGAHITSFHARRSICCRGDRRNDAPEMVAVFSGADRRIFPAPAIHGSSSISFPRFTFIDLFAGIGGMRLGFEEAGGKCVFSCEYDSYAQKTYQANFKDSHGIHGDIRGVDASMVPDHDVLLAGFPCQPFSLAGVSIRNFLDRAHGFACKTQGTLFFDVARIIAAKRPRAFLLENVKNLLSHDKGRTFRIIMHTLEHELGYHVSYRVIDARHLVPQHRERIFIAGFRQKNSFSLNFLDLSDGREHRLRDILHEFEVETNPLDRGRYAVNREVLPKYVLSDRLWAFLQSYAAKHRVKGNGFGFSLNGSKDISRTLTARYHKDGSEILISMGDGRNPRRLTPRECARLMGFPETFTIPVSDTRAYRQFGNSVVVPVVSFIARHMLHFLRKTDASSGKSENSSPYPTYS